MSKTYLYRSRALALLLIFVFLALPGCGSGSSGGGAQPSEPSEGAENQAATKAGSTRVAKEKEPSGEATVEALRPEDVLPEKELTGVPEFSEWEDEGEDVQKAANPSDSSVGAIPAVKPYNFGRDPGGPEDKTLYLTVPKLGIDGIPVFDSITEEKLKESVIHVPATGFPWQEGANTYIAGHRIGYEGTGSFQVFYELDQLEIGDEISVLDSDGGEYYYTVTEEKVVGPENVEVMEPVPGQSTITLQTCTLPDYKERVLVQGELVEKSA
ncbi:MAG: sortase [Rubrobacteraceae bacterium]